MLPVGLLMIFDPLHYFTSYLIKDKLIDLIERTFNALLTLHVTTENTFFYF